MENKMSETIPKDIYLSQSARDAQAGGYGNPAYWNLLDDHAQELHDYFMRKGDEKTAKEMFTRSLSEALRGNDGV